MAIPCKPADVRECNLVNTYTWYANDSLNEPSGCAFLSLLNALQNDVCLESSPFVPISPDQVEFDERHPYIDDLSRVTWYANGNQWKPSASEELFNTYDFVIALTGDLLKRYPLGSIVRVTSVKTGNSVFARVIDLKPSASRSADLSKIVAYSLGFSETEADESSTKGGYGLIREGRFNITIERYRPKGVDPIYRQTNVFFSLGEWNYSSDPHGYEDALKTLWSFAQYLRQNTREYKAIGFPRPHLMLVHRSLDNGSEELIVQLRFGPFRSEGEITHFYPVVDRFVANDPDLSLVEVSEIFGELVRYDYPDSYQERIFDKRSQLPLPVNCSSFFVSIPSLPAPVARNWLIENFDIHPEFSRVIIPWHKWDARPFVELREGPCVDPSRLLDLYIYLNDLHPGSMWCADK